MVLVVPSHEVKRRNDTLMNCTMYTKNKINLGFNNVIAPNKSVKSITINNIKNPAKSLIAEINSKSAVDSHLADNLVPFLALFGGKIKTSEITNHAKTNIYAAEKFLGKIFGINEEGIITASLSKRSKL